MTTSSFRFGKNSLIRRALLCSAGAYLLLPLAASAETLSGQVIDARSQAPLEAASVTITDTGHRTSTDEQGRFQFANIAPGTVQLLIRYLGLEPQSQSVTVAPGTGAGERIILEPAALTMDAMVVSGTTGAQIAALNQQRVSTRISNVVSADQAGRFPDANAAEAMRRIPGVSIAREEKGGDGRYVSIRGLDSGLNAFSLNGVRVAQTDEENRRVPLDTIHTRALSKITVYKSLSPDLDGDGIGGAVEMSTATAFELGQRMSSLTTEGIYQDFAGDMGYLVSGTYADIFGDEDQFGVFAAFTVEDRDTAGYVVGNDEAWLPVDDARATEVDAWHPGEEFEYNTYANHREKWGFSGSFEWKASETTELYFKASMNQFTDTELNNGRHFVMDDFEFGALQDPAVPLSYSTSNGVLAYGEYEQTEWELSNYILGGTTHAGAVRLDYSASYSTGQQEEPRDYEVFYAVDLNDPVGWDLSRRDFPQPILSPVDAARLADPDNYEFDEVDMDYDQSEDTKWAVKLDATWKPSETLAVKTGFKGQFSTRELNEANRFQSEDARHATLAESGLLGDSSSFADMGQSLTILGFDPAALDQLFTRRNDLFFDTTNPIPDEDSYVADEAIYAGYLMGTWNLDKWELVAGARVEYTEIETNNQELVVIVDEDDPAYGSGQPGWNPYEEENYLLAPLITRSTYTEVLPRLQVNYRASDRLVYRSAAFTSLARPEFQFVSGATEAERDGGEYEVALGNPDLAAAYAWNFDLGVEYYLEGMGVVSVNGFYKIIDGFIFNATAPANEFDGEYLGAPATFEQPVNGNTATINGIEFNYVTRFTKLPGVASGLGFYGNLTMQDSEADTGLDDPTQTDVPFFNAPDYVGTVALTYDRSGWDASLSYSFRDGSLDELIGGLNIYAQPYESLDLQLAYTYRRVTFSFKMQDLLDTGDTPIRTLTRGESSRYLNENAWNGRTMRFGITWSL